MAKTIHFNHHYRTVDRYTNGDCGILAEAISQLTSWPVCIVRYGPRGWPYHAVVQTPDGRYLDIEGIWTRNSLLQRWRCKSLARATKKEWSGRLKAWHPSDLVGRTRPLARRVVRRAFEAGVDR